MDVFSGNTTMGNSPSFNNSGLNTFNNSLGSFGSNIQNANLPKKLKITAWVLFLISIIFSILLI